MMQLDYRLCRNRAQQRRGRTCRLVLWAAAIILATSESSTAHTEASTETSRAERLAQMQLIFCFQGKGSCLPYDAGVVQEAYARIPALRDERVIVAGNSSGSILAAYFSCFGFTDRSVRYAQYRVLTGDKEAVRNMENPHSKAAKLIRGRRTEIPHMELREYIAFALGVTNWRQARSIDDIIRQSRARPKLPVLIVAANKEVLEDAHPDDRLAPRGYKELDPSNMIVSWKPEVHAYYREHPDQFARDHPHLRLGRDRRIGRAVTFFVDRSLYELLSRIPADERMADLRLMTNARDLTLAMLASTSEPTYFDPVEDPDPSKILAGERPGDLGAVRRRTYYGGYLVAMPAQDVRRMLPGIRVLGSGWRHNPSTARRLLEAWLLADVEPIAQLNEWWADMEVLPDAEFQSHMVFRDLSAQQELEFGRRRAAECFDRDEGLPFFVERPKYCYAAAQAIWPEDRAEDMWTNETLPDGQRVLGTLRGLGPLLDKVSNADRPQTGSAPGPRR